MQLHSLFHCKDILHIVITLNPQNQETQTHYLWLKCIIIFNDEERKLFPQASVLFASIATTDLQTNPKSELAPQFCSTVGRQLSPITSYCYFFLFLHSTYAVYKHFVSGNIANLAYHSVSFLNNMYPISHGETKMLLIQGGVSFKKFRLHYSHFQPTIIDFVS